MNPGAQTCAGKSQYFVGRCLVSDHIPTLADVCSAIAEGSIVATLDGTMYQINALELRRYLNKSRRSSSAFIWYIVPSRVATILPSAIALQTSASVGIWSDTRHLPTKYCDFPAHVCAPGFIYALLRVTGKRLFLFPTGAIC